MMKTKLFFWLVFLSIGMQAQNINFPDAKFKQALIGGINANNNFVVCYDQNGTNILVDQNDDGEIQMSEAALVYRIDFRQVSNYTTLEGINSFVNLESIYYINDSSYSHSHGKIGSINLDGLGNFKTFNLSGCDIEKVSVKNCPNVLEIRSAYTDSYNGTSSYNMQGNTQELIVQNCPQVKTIAWTGNNLGSANITNCPNLTHLELRGNSLVTFDASQFSNLDYFDVSNNQQTNGSIFGEPNNNPSLTSLNVNGLSKLKYLNVSNQLLTSLNLAQMSFLEILNCKNNKITNTLDISQSSRLTYLDFSANQIKAISLPDLSDISTFLANNNLLENNGLDFTKLFAVKNLNRTINLSYNNLNQNITLSSSGVSFMNLDLSYNKISDFKVSGTFSSWSGEANLLLNDNLLEHIDLGDINSLNNLNVSNNPLAEIDTPNLETGFLDFSNTNVSYIKLNSESRVAMNLLATGLGSTTLKVISQSGSIALEGSQSLETIDLSDSRIGIEQIQNMPLLKSIYMKNGIKDQIYGGFSNLPNLKFVCADEMEIENIKTQLSRGGVTNVNVNSYCSFTPGGNYNTISGTVRFDANANGCDSTDEPFEFLKLKINDGTNSGETFVQNDGKYEFFSQAGNFDLTAHAENPGLFSITPAAFNTSFADNNNNVFTQDICVTANGTQNDAEVVIAPLTGARPGFEATYKLVWRNKGNTTLSGKIVLNYDQNKMTFQSSSLPYAAISNGSLEFNYSNLKPYANEATELIFTINTPTNPTNPVNSGDILSFNAQITPNASDLTPEDNNFKFDQTVVNSFDPNDITCMEGEIIPTTAVGKYMHYVVNFENTGTAEAENIVVKMKIDPAEFDINTLQLQNASSDVTTVITGNDVEFKFKKIKLKAGGHGNVLLKVRSVTDLQEGDSVDNSADIYFDYNFPITTNEYVTTILDEHSLLNAKINYEASEFASNNYKVNFDASLSTGNITSYTWEFPNAASVSSTSAVKPMVTYNVAGNYTAKLTISDVDNNLSVKTITFKVGNTTADLSTGRDNNGNAIAIDADDDDWKGYDINGTEITPKIRHTYPGWSYADIGNGNNSQWISLNNFEGYYNYKSRAFTIPNNATDAKLNLRSLSFVRNWTYLVKVEADGSETETEITKTQWQSDGFKGWLNGRSPKVDNYSLSPGTYYIKVLVYSNNSAVRESLDVNAIVTCSTGLMNANKLVPPTITLQTQDVIKQNISVYPVPTHGELNIDSDSDVLSVEVHDVLGRILQKKHFAPSRKVKLTINNGEGIYFLKIMTKQGIVNQKIIKE
ncbi:DUF7619 domain-containing protein [Epilithonimonas hungarica]|uniref:Por secretion system C-terminal sorting domain-containing protein n=1 Tax=Epilithonimonas hungarica TaxID=454006 RepID=A0A1G7FWZ1_9FLAO|nr:PKD domain-containing protein [Epilithonimonas hungarica]SDE80448.1 Por secretion system C-terminal sorting domain-containing protein [Epilithonimonas hungarica]